MTVIAASDVIEGLAALAAFLEAHPDLPLGNHNPLVCSVNRGSDEENRAEVNRIAAILGVPAGDDTGDGTHWSVRRDFGGGVAYSAFAFTARERARWTAHMAGFHQMAVKAA